MTLLSSLLKYIDVFGTKFTFYTNKKPRLYTMTGGVLSSISILGCILTFIFFSLDDLNGKFPNTSTSSTYEGYKKIKFGKEKIWIPWRIVDYNNNKFINHTGLLFPIIYYYSGYKNKQTKTFNLTTKILNYKLCSETSMANEDFFYHITVPLNELYCIDMEDLDMGGSWISEFIDYVQFDLYFCQDGINYNENNRKCSTINEIRNYIGINNSLEMDIYFPIVQYQPNNKTYPLIVIYRQHFYHISRYTNKIERLYLQQNILTDDLGWILKKESNYSYWGLNTINDDTYFNGEEKDLLIEGSNSRLYSFNIYLKPEVNHYKRNYKKLHFIISDFFPMAYIIFIVMKNISKIFKKAESNKKIMELLFENLKEKPIIFKKNLDQLKIKKFDKISFNGDNGDKENEKNIKFYNAPKMSVDISQNIKNNMNSSSFILNKNVISSSNNNITSTLTKAPYLNFQSNNKITINDSGKKSIILKEPYFPVTNSLKNRNFKDNTKIREKKRLIKEKLFPYKNYLFSVFIKNLNITQKNIFFSTKFSKIYIFLSQLFDITAYLSLQREFNILKKILKDKNLNSIEKYQKININSPTFLQEINDCIDNQKFHILAKVT